MARSRLRGILSVAAALIHTQVPRAREVPPEGWLDAVEHAFGPEQETSRKAQGTQRKAKKKRQKFIGYSCDAVLEDSDGRPVFAKPARTPLTLTAPLHNRPLPFSELLRGISV